jgi:integrase-like protein
MSIRRRETKAGVRYDVQWRLPDRSKRKKTFSSERAAKQFEAKPVTGSATGESLDPRGGRTELETVYRSWIASRADLSAKVRRGYEDNSRLRIQPRFCNWPIAKIDHESIQRWVNEMSAFRAQPPDCPMDTYGSQDVAA